MEVVCRGQDTSVGVATRSTLARVVGEETKPDCAQHDNRAPHHRPSHPQIVGRRHTASCRRTHNNIGVILAGYQGYGWLDSRVVSVLDSGAEGAGSNRSRDAVG